MKIVDVNGIKLYYLYVDKFTTSRFGIIFQTHLFSLWEFKLWVRTRQEEIF